LFWFFFFLYCYSFFFFFNDTATTEIYTLSLHDALPISPQGKYDEYEGSKKEHDKAITMIPAVAAPLKDPVYGREGPLHRLWKRKASMSRS